MSVAAFGFLAAFDWTDLYEYPYSDALHKISQTLLVVSIGFAAAALLLSRGASSAEPRITRLTMLTLIATGGVATVLSIGTIAEVSDTFYWRVVAIVGALWALGIALVPALRGMGAISDR